MLYGCDISNWNTLTPAMAARCDFVIHKASEGRSYVDRKMQLNMQKWVEECLINDKPILKGFYHFARPQNGNSVKEELSNFMQAVPNPDWNTIIALDIEAGAENYPEWCYEWCRQYYDATGVRPLIYTSQSNVKRFEKCYEMNCGLWVAQYKHYGNRFPLVKPDSVRPWSFFALWQWSNGRYNIDPIHPHVPGKVDQDMFNGTIVTWKKYGKGDN